MLWLSVRVQQRKIIQIKNSFKPFFFVRSRNNCKSIAKIDFECKVTHYSEIIRRSGPLCFMSALRFEMKHKQLTNTMKSAVNHINVTKSISQKFLRSSLFDEIYTDHIEHSKPFKLDSQLSNKYRHLLADFDLSSVYRVKNLQFNNDYYETRLILKHNVNFFEI